MLKICDTKGRCYDEDQIAIIFNFIESGAGESLIPGWKQMSELPPVYKVTRKMFVARGRIPDSGYITDPYCVWREDDGSFARWPHRFEPTMFLELP